MTGGALGSAVREYVRERASHHLALLDEGLRESCSELTRFQSWIAARMRRLGLAVEEFHVDPEELVGQPACRRTLSREATKLRGGPNVVGSWPGEGRDGVLLFAHADKSPEMFLRGRSQPRLVERDGRLHGPGIADDVSGVTAMLSAVETSRRLGLVSRRRLLVASHLGKQLGVLGTHGLMRRFDPLDHAIYVHPAESGAGLGEIHVTSNGMVEFVIDVEGKPPDSADPIQTMYVDSAISAADKGVHVYQGLAAWAVEAGARHRKPEVEPGPDNPFALLLSGFEAGAGSLAYEVPLRCRLQGTVCFPPPTRMSEVQVEFERAFHRLVDEDPWLSRGHSSLEWGDNMGEAAETDLQGDLVSAARAAILEVTKEVPRLNRAYALSDTRYPLVDWKAQAIGLGPECGGLGTKDEWIDREQYLDTIAVVAELLQRLLSEDSPSPA